MSDEKKLIVKLNEKPFKDGEIAPDKDAVLITDGADSDKLKRVLLENLVAGGGGGDGTSWEFINFDPNIGKEGTPQDPDPYIPENEDTIAAVRLTPDDKGGTLYKFNPLGDGTPFNPYWHHLFDISVESGTTWEVVAFDPNDQDGQGNHYVPENENTIVFVDPVTGTPHDGNVYKYNPDDGAHGKPFWTLLFNVINSGGAGGAPLIFGHGDPNDESVDGNDGYIFVDNDSGIFYKYDGVESRWEAQLRSAESLILFETSDPDEYTKVPVKEDTLILNTSNGKLFKYTFTGEEWVNVYTFNTGGGGGDEGWTVYSSDSLGEPTKDRQVIFANLLRDPVTGVAEPASPSGISGSEAGTVGFGLEDGKTVGAPLAIGQGAVAVGSCNTAKGFISFAGIGCKVIYSEMDTTLKFRINKPLVGAGFVDDKNIVYYTVASSGPVGQTKMINANAITSITDEGSTLLIETTIDDHNPFNAYEGYVFPNDGTPFNANLTGGGAINIHGAADADGLGAVALATMSKATGFILLADQPFSKIEGIGLGERTHYANEYTHVNNALPFSLLDMGLPAPESGPASYTRVFAGCTTSESASALLRPQNPLTGWQDIKLPQNGVYFFEGTLIGVGSDLNIATKVTFAVLKDGSGVTDLDVTGIGDEEHVEITLTEGSSSDILEINLSREQSLTGGESTRWVAKLDITWVGLPSDPQN